MFTQTINQERKLPTLTEPPTARQAFAVVAPVAAQYDPEARLVRVSSGENISYLGTASSWEWVFLLPNRRARALFRTELRLDPQTGLPDANYLVERIMPFPEAGAVVAQMRGAGTMTDATINQAWQQELLARPPLPIPFRDSPEAVQSLSAQGADFVDSDDPLSLTSKLLANGDAVWSVLIEDDEYQTPFA